MTALQWIVKEAKKLKKEYPKRFSTWREYVAQASAIYAKKHKGKSPVGKKHSVGAVKKKTAKKSAPKKKAAKSYHKDTKSHNVNIRVMSGTSQMSTLNHLIKEKEKAESKLYAMNVGYKNTGDLQSKKQFKFWINRYKKYLGGLKKQISEAKKHI